MGIFDRLQAHLKQSTSPVEPPEEPLRGLVISSPRPPSPSQRTGRSDYFTQHAIEVEDEVEVDEDGLPTYNHLFPNGPYRWFRDPPRPINPARPPKDPRRLVKEPRKIPLPVIDILCSHIDRSSMAILALLNRSMYDVVIPHLYRQITIDRYTLPKILYGIPLPIVGFTFDPQAIFDRKGKQKQVYREEDVIPRTVEERKRRCLKYVREIVLDQPLVDWRLCQSLLILRDPEYGRDASDSQPFGQYHPMREPEDASASSTDSIGTNTILMPNVETVYLTSEGVAAMNEWEKSSDSPHILLDATHALCGPKLQIKIITKTTRSGTGVGLANEALDETFDSRHWLPPTWK